jgi:hypothetical protein
MSTFDTTRNLRAALPGEGPLYRLSASALNDLPDGLAYFKDGRNFGLGGTAPRGHVTIYPTKPMSFSAFQKLVKNLPWERVDG